MRRLPRRKPHDLAAMRRAGRVVAEMHEAIRAVAAAGVTTGDLDRAARKVLADNHAGSNFLGYHGFPAVICASVNDEVIHGIPGGRELHDGDVVSIDCGAIVDGWHGDAAFTMGIGAISADAQRLLKATEESLHAGIAQCLTTKRIGDIGAAVQGVAEDYGYSVVREFVGHGIGTSLHEDPQVPNYGPPGRRERLVPGLCLAIEPMVNVGRPEVRVLDDGWTAVTVDGSLSAHFELSLAVTRHGPWVLSEPYPYGREEETEAAAHA